MDVGLDFVGHGCPSKSITIYSASPEALTFVGAAQGIQKGKQLEAAPFGGVVCNTTTF
ncbi:hypothetical protein [Parashewanella curva]|uniref:hypothetical protein n=1 Tax=Parashewanella curva TaxID=2338552 RepID=UPI0014048825|nr:hypothetical protein [Parashewanella curva]